jgi:hypothetical protein
MPTSFAFGCVIRSGELLSTGCGGTSLHHQRRTRSTSIFKSGFAMSLHGIDNLKHDPKLATALGNMVVAWAAAETALMSTLVYSRY